MKPRSREEAQKQHKSSDQSASVDLKQLQKNLAPKFIGNYSTDCSSNAKKNIFDESSEKKNHIQILVSMLDEKNEYIKVLHKKVDRLNVIISKNKDIPRSRSIERSKSANCFYGQSEVNLTVAMASKFDLIMDKLGKMKDNNSKCAKILEEDGESFFEEESSDLIIKDYIQDTSEKLRIKQPSRVEPGEDDSY